MVSDAMTGRKIQTEYERLAREQLNLDEHWHLEVISRALPIGLEDQIDKLEADDELCDNERWREIADYSAPLAWLPKGVIQVGMAKGSGDDRQRKVGFIVTHGEPAG